jgi:hypothetical protein
MVTGEQVGQAVGRWWDKLPPESHPLWKILQSAVAIVGVGFLITHMAHEGVDLHGAVGAVTGGSITLLAKNLLGK